MSDETKVHGNANDDRSEAAMKPIDEADPHGPPPSFAPEAKTGGAPRPAPASRPKSYRLYWIVAAVLLVLSLVGWLFHHLQAGRAKQASEDAQNRLPSVGVVEVKASPGSTDLLLPGTISPITEASLYARASGYLRERYADIGDTVKRGQVLAIVDSPDLDQQVLQGRAAVAQATQQLGQTRASVDDAQARLALARITAERTDELGRDNAVSQQEVDQRRQERDTAGASLTMSIANVGASEANLRAARANADRLVVLQDFEKIRAPFDGIVTARNVDVGALIGAGGASASTSGTPSSSSSEGATTSGSSGAASSGSSSAGTSGQSMELFRVGQVDRLRVFVTVPQENAGAVEPGNDASVFVTGFPQPFVGRVTRTARSLDPTARTLLTEVQIDNPRRLLMPGMYSQVRFASPRASPPLLVPGEAVIARASGLTVAVIEDLRPGDRQRLPKAAPTHKEGAESDKSDQGDQAAKGDEKDDGHGATKEDDDPQHARRIHLQPIRVGRDYGTEIEVLDGLTPGATIVANPGDFVADGALVMTKKRPDAPKAEPGADQPQGNQSPSMQAPTTGRN